MNKPHWENWMSRWIYLDVSDMKVWLEECYATVKTYNDVMEMSVE